MNGARPDRHRKRARRRGTGRRIPFAFATLMFLAGCIDVASPRRFPSATETMTSRVSPQDGATLFARHCATCHLGGGGLLGSPRTPDLFEDPLPRGEGEEAILQAMRFGIDAPRMPTFETGLELEEMQRIAAFIALQRGRRPYSGDHTKRTPAPKR